MATLRLVLLGGSGFVGSAVMRQLAAATGPKAAHVLVHRSPLPRRYEFAAEHAGAMQALPPALFPDEPHVVVHCATKQIDRDGAGFDENRAGMDSLARAINRHTRAVIFASSCSVYGSGPQRGIDERAPIRPDTPLARSRSGCETVLAALAHGSRCKAVVLRPRFVVGQGDRHFVPGLAKLARLRVAMGSGRQRFSIIDVDDYARLILELARLLSNGDQRLGSFEAFNVGYARPISLDEIWGTLCEVHGLPAARLRIPAPEPLLRLLDLAPSRAARGLATRLRLLGHDHHAVTNKLRGLLDGPLLSTDPRLVLRRAVLAGGAP